MLALSRRLLCVQFLLFSLVTEALQIQRKYIEFYDMQNYTVDYYTVIEKGMPQRRNNTVPSEHLYIL